MARLSLRLPDTLHQQLVFRAHKEGVSLNQYLVFLLAQNQLPAYIALPVRETAEEQRTAFAKLCGQLGSASPEEVQKILDERELVAAEPEWAPDLRARFEKQLAKARNPAHDV